MASNIRQDIPWRPGGWTSHKTASPNKRSEPREKPLSTAKGKFSHWLCPECLEWWTGVNWGRTCPYCGIVRLPGFEHPDNFRDTEHTHD